MDVMISPNKTVDTFLQRIQQDFPDILIKKSQKSYWDPKNNIVFFNADQKNPIWSLLHEIGHMQRNHTKYSLDVELLVMETEAWESAKILGQKYGVAVDSDYIEDCLDSYRDWLYKRSTCPNCKQTGIQANHLEYNCLNCRTKWRVSASRFCRSYRMKIQKQPA